MPVFFEPDTEGSHIVFERQRIVDTPELHQAAVDDHGVDNSRKDCPAERDNQDRDGQLRVAWQRMYAGIPFAGDSCVALLS